MKPEPFAAVLRRLVAERETTLRQVAIRAGLSYTTIAKAAHGELVPRIPTVEKIARVLEVEPEVFAEWRLMKAQDALDWRRHGLAKALRALR